MSFAVFRRNDKARWCFVLGMNGADSLGSFYDDAGIFCCTGEAIDDGLGVIRGWENPSVGFCFEWDASVFEPLDGFGGAPAMKWADERPVASGVEFGEFFGVKTGVGDITPPAARYFDFCEDVGSFFQNENAGSLAQITQGFGCGDGGKVAGSATADHDEIPGSVHAGGGLSFFFKFELGPLDGGVKCFDGVVDEFVEIG